MGGGTQRRLAVRRFSETEGSLAVRLAVLLILGGMLAYGLVSFWRMIRQTSLDSRALFFMPVALAGALGVVAWRSWVVARQLRREIRGADTGRPELAVAIAAFWKGILYDSSARESVLELFGSLQWTERLELHERVARQALRAELKGKKVLDYASELLDISEDSLRRQDEKNSRGEDESRLLDPLKQIVREAGASPARQLLELWEETGGDIAALIDFTS